MVEACLHPRKKHAAAAVVFTHGDAFEVVMKQSRQAMGSNAGISVVCGAGGIFTKTHIAHEIPVGLNAEVANGEGELASHVAMSWTTSLALNLANPGIRG